MYVCMYVCQECRTTTQADANSGVSLAGVCVGTDFAAGQQRPAPVDRLSPFWLFRAYRLRAPVTWFMRLAV